MKKHGREKLDSFFLFSSSPFPFSRSKGREMVRSSSSFLLLRSPARCCPLLLSGRACSLSLCSLNSKNQHIKIRPTRKSRVSGKRRLRARMTTARTVPAPRRAPPTTRAARARPRPRRARHRTLLRARRAPTPIRPARHRVLPLRTNAALHGEKERRPTIEGRSLFLVPCFFLHDGGSSSPALSADVASSTFSRCSTELEGRAVARRRFLLAGRFDAAADDCGGSGSDRRGASLPFSSVARLCRRRAVVLSRSNPTPPRRIY